MTSPPRCVFCGLEGSSDEDVFAKWTKAVVGGDFFELRRHGGRAKTNLRYLGVKTRAPCRKCNNEWMSLFEESAKPLLIPVIRGERTTWASTEERTNVARWAFKTALMIDRSGRPDLWTAPEKDFGYLFRHQEPPPSVTIVTGHYLPQRSEEAHAAWAGVARASGTDRQGFDFKGYRITFGVGHAIFRVYGQSDRDRNGFVFDTTVTVDGQPLRDAFRRLWPLAPIPHDWPPQGANFATGGLPLLDPLRDPGGR